MRLSTKVRYGTRALVELYNISSDSSPVISSILAKNQNISLKYLESLMTKMKKNGIIKSTLGCKGGYILAKEAENISLYDIYTALEGNLELTPCQSASKCSSQNHCLTEKLWARLANSFIEDMEKIKLADIIKD